MKVDLIGKPALLTDIKYGDLFYTQVGRRIYPCIKTFMVKNDTDLVDQVVAFMPSDRDRTHLPRLLEAKPLETKSVYRISDPVFRPVISESSLLMDTEYWPTPGIAIESPEASYLTVKSGRMPHKIMYLNINTGELISTSPKAPLVFVLEWKIVLEQEDTEQTLVRFPITSPMLLKDAATL